MKSLALGRVRLSAEDCDIDRLANLVGATPQRYPALFESAARHPKIGRRSFLFAFPGAPIVARAGASFFDDLDAAHRAANGFGHVVYLGYEALTDVERVAVPDSPPPFPRAFALPVAAAVVVDRETGEIEIRGDAEAVDAVRKDLARIANPRRSTGGRPRSAEADRSTGPLRALAVEEDDPAVYLNAVLRAKEFIAAGDIYQANLSREWRLTIESDVGPLAIYRALRAANPAPFAALLRFEDAAIVSSSPERLAASDGRLLESRPIAGTRPRIGFDCTMVAELLSNAKERAEHVMLVDLIRNDLGRVAQFGTVEVDERLVVESYAHVHHIVSNVRAAMRSGVTPGRALAAMFPGGTITGCPKVRCIEIIAQLEGAGRGAYTGSLGYVAADGSMDFNILIRTLVWQSGRVTFRAGAGIVADSEPEFELAETRAKARGMLRAFGLDA